MKNGLLIELWEYKIEKKLTDVWNDNGVEEPFEYGILTNDIYKEWSGMSTKEYKSYKGLKKESLRDNMSDVEVTLANLGEIATRELAKEHKPYGLDENRKIAKRGGNIAKITRDNLEKELGRTVITNKNNLNYKYIDKQELIENMKMDNGKGVDVMEFIEYSKCSTCKKAKKFLDDNDIKYVDRAIKESTPTYDEISLWIDKFSIPIKKLFNTSGIMYRELNLKEKLDNMSDDEKIRLLSSDGMLIKRPLLVSDDVILIGFKEKEWKEYFDK